tara:strand:+ start:143 stop:454 length:312 start_codon:yes stop_codon:yes gene_type:complete
MFDSAVVMVKDGVTLVTQSTWVLFALLVTLHQSGILLSLGVKGSVRRILFLVFLFGDVSGTFLGCVRSIAYSFLFILLCVLIARLLYRVDDLHEHLNTRDRVR